MSAITFKCMYDDVPPKKQPIKKQIKQKKECIVEHVTDTADINSIRSAICDVLYLIDISHEKNYVVKITPTKPNCYRAVITNKVDRKVVSDYWIEKGGTNEFVFSPPLTLESMKNGNRSEFKTRW